MKEDKIKIELEVFDELIEVNVSKSDVKRYLDAAKFVTDRFETYAKMYLGTRSQHTLALMTMLDIAVKCMPDNTYKGQCHSFWGKIVDYMNKLSLLIGQVLVRNKH